MQQLWRPDTCSCMIIYDLDTLQATQTTFREINYPVQCALHSYVALHEIYSVLLAENQRKNWSINYALEQYPTNTFYWQFDSERKIQLFSDDLPSDQLAPLQHFIDMNFNG